MKNSKLKISEFEKYSLPTKSQNIIKGGQPYEWLNPNDIDENELPDDPTNPGWTGGPGGSAIISTYIKSEIVDQIKVTTQYFSAKP